MSQRTKQLRKLQADLAQLTVPIRVQQLRDFIVGGGPAPTWCFALPQDEKEAFWTSFWLAHPVLALTFNMRWAEGLPPSVVADLWSELILLDEQRGDEFVGMDSTGKKGVYIDRAEEVIGQVIAQHRV